MYDNRTPSVGASTPGRRARRSSGTGRVSSRFLNSERAVEVSRGGVAPWQRRMALQAGISGISGGGDPAGGRWCWARWMDEDVIPVLPGRGRNLRRLLHSFIAVLSCRWPRCGETVHRLSGVACFSLRTGGRALLLRLAHSPRGLRPSTETASTSTEESTNNKPNLGRRKTGITTSRCSLWAESAASLCGGKSSSRWLPRRVTDLQRGNAHCRDRPNHQDCLLTSTRAKLDFSRPSGFYTEDK